MNNIAEQSKFTAWKNYRDALMRGPGGFKGLELAAWDSDNPAPTPTL